jgi:hypothetical protein
MPFTCIRGLENPRYAFSTSQGSLQELPGFAILGQQIQPHRIDMGFPTARLEVFVVEDSDERLFCDAAFLRADGRA